MVNLWRIMVNLRRMICASVGALGSVVAIVLAAKTETEQKEE